MTRRYDAALAAIGVAGVAASLAAAPDARGLFGAVLALTMLGIAASDARRFIIPNPLIAVALTLALGRAIVIDGPPTTHAVALAAVRAAVAAGGFYALMIVYDRLRGQPGIGFGDVKLAAVAGAWLDWMNIIVAIELAAVAALCVQMLRGILRGRKLRATQVVPFGMYFAPAIWLAWLIDVVWLHP